MVASWNLPAVSPNDDDGKRAAIRRGHVFRIPFPPAGEINDHALVIRFENGEPRVYEAWPGFPEVPFSPRERDRGGRSVLEYALALSAVTEAYQWNGDGWIRV